MVRQRKDRSRAFQGEAIRLLIRIVAPQPSGANDVWRESNLSIWLATQVSSLGWLMQTVSTFDLMVELVRASSNPVRLHFVLVPRGPRRQFQPAPGHVRRPEPDGYSLSGAIWAWHSVALWLPLLAS